MNFPNTRQKTYLIDQATRRQVMALFGTVANAIDKLKLTIAYQTMNQALRGMPGRPEQGITNVIRC